MSRPCYSLPALLLVACAPLPPRLASTPCARLSDSACVNVGYGMQSRRTITGATSSYVVQQNDVSSMGRLEELLEGRLPGVTVTRVNGDYTIHVRNFVAQNNRGEALIVIDGIPSPIGLTPARALGAIAPSSVLRVDVLKDAGSTSAYGARGVNGVILITTRR